MDEMYRMLGREHEADLEREAAKWRRAAEVCNRPAAEASPDHIRMREGVQRVRACIASLGGRSWRSPAAVELLRDYRAMPGPPESTLRLPSNPTSE